MAGQKMNNLNFSTQPGKFWYIGDTFLMHMGIMAVLFVSVSVTHLLDIHPIVYIFLNMILLICTHEYAFT